MRIVAIFRASEDFFPDAPLSIQEVLQENGFVLANEPDERIGVVNELVQDLGEADRIRFESSLELVFRHINSRAVASINVLYEARFVEIRIRHRSLQRLGPVGDKVVHDIMNQYGTTGSPGRDRIQLYHCETRERGEGEGFLYASWRGGETKFRRFLFAERRATFIVALFAIGLTLEVALTFFGGDDDFSELGRRLGGPMLVSSLVLILERFAQWRDQRSPTLRWSTAMPELEQQRLRLLDAA